MTHVPIVHTGEARDTDLSALCTNPVYRAYCKSFTAHEVTVFEARMDRLQRERPLTGYRLHCRLRCLRGRILYGIIGNRSWSLSLRAKQNYLRRWRSGNPLLSPHQKKFYAKRLGVDPERFTERSPSHATHVR